MTKMMITNKEKIFHVLITFNKEKLQLLAKKPSSIMVNNIDFYTNVRVNILSYSWDGCLKIAGNKSLYNAFFVFV